MPPAGPRCLPRAWPQYIPRPKERTLAVMIPDGRLLTEHGEYLTPRTWQELSDLIFENNLETWIGPVMAAIQGWHDEMAADMRQEGRRERGRWCELIYGDNRRELTKLRLWRMWPNCNGKLCWQVRELTISAVWNRAVEYALTRDLRALFDLLQVGVHSTPGQAGTATVKRLWSGTRPSEMRRHYRPSLVLIKQLEEHMIGSRREAYRPDEIFDEAYEVDCKNGYASQVGELPCGFPTYYKNGQTELWTDPRGDYFTWWGECYVRIYDQGLAPGDVAPFAVRDEEGKLHWPTAAGLYHTWLWSFEAEEIRRREMLGEPIRCLGVREAWAWPDSTKQLKRWQLDMDALRTLAEGISPEVAALVKQCIVATIGAFGLPYEFSEVSIEPQEGSIPLEGPNLPDQTLHLTKKFKDSGTLKHWQAYTLGRMNYSIYQALRRVFLEEQAEQTVIAVNVDGIITSKPVYWATDPKFTRMGEYKLKKLGTWVACPGPGMVLDPDNQDIRVPGMSLDQKVHIMGLKRIGERIIPRKGEPPPYEQMDRYSWYTVAHASAERLRRYIRKGAP